MRLIVGLGNPGPEYAASRHNAGFRIVECFAQRHALVFARRRFRGRFASGRVRDLHLALLEPLTYMNLSGRSVLEAVRELELEDLSRDLVVVLDDVDLPFGRLRIRPGGGAGGHRGLADVIERLRRNDFPRLRFGIGRPPPGVETADYVLEPFPFDEQAALGACLERATDALEAILWRGVESAMNAYNPAAGAEAPPA